MTEENNSPTSTITADTSKSALQDNIDRMGKHAYYFAHAHKATGPEWDGKIEPRLLSCSSSTLGEGCTEGAATGSVAAVALASRSISLSESNITNYAFTDEGDRVKIYVHLPGVGCTPTENVALESSETSLRLTIKDYYAAAPPNPAEDKNDDLIRDAAECESDGEGEADGAVDGQLVQPQQPRGEDRCLSFARLYGEIESATFKKKPDKIIVVLKKKSDKAWTSVIA